MGLCLVAFTAQIDCCVCFLPLISVSLSFFCAKETWSLKVLTFSDYTFWFWRFGVSDELNLWHLWIVLSWLENWHLMLFPVWRPQLEFQLLTNLKWLFSLYQYSPVIWILRSKYMLLWSLIIRDIHALVAACLKSSSLARLGNCRKISHNIYLSGSI